MSRIMRDAAHVGGSRCCRQTALLKVMPDRVIVADIGSVSRPFKFAWAAVDLSHPEPVGCGDDPGNCVDALLDAIGSESRVALRLEAPMAVLVPSAEAHPTTSRPVWRFPVMDLSPRPAASPRCSLQRLRVA